ncbi:hypothetical protein FH972_022025 [Carpinus fangiana]|uniref:Uncharacterized protein n=1 Tax=Carpinus fangiana TaxID=176857 RepID=A0A5N6KRL5_9ROSI|nr:hypothetical protein FH972_022025 [Carpinus fangiana]
MVALSAFHERCETVGVPLLEDQNSFSHPTSSDAFALRQYTKAIQLLRHRLTYGEQSHVVTLLSCVLFICLEFLRGNKDSAITHLRGGLDIIRSRLPSAPPSNHLQTNLTPSDILEGNLVPLFARLSVLQSLYGQPRSSNYGPSAHGPFLELLDVEVGPSRSFFDDLNEARVSAVNIINSTFRFAFMIDYEYFPSEDIMWATQSALLAQSQGWSDAMDVLTTTLSDEELPYAHLLSAHNFMTRVWMLSAPERTQCAFDSHLETFERIHDLCLPLISHLEGASSKRPSFTLDAGLLSTLFFASTKCRHRVQRRKFITLMQRAPVREGLWNAAEVLKVAEKCVGVEEEPISSEPYVMYPPELSRIHDMDIQSRSIEDPGRQFVRLKMKPLGLDHEFVWRTEHIKW